MVASLILLSSPSSTFVQVQLDEAQVDCDGTLYYVLERPQGIVVASATVVSAVVAVAIGNVAIASVLSSTSPLTVTIVTVVRHTPVVDMGFT